MCGRFALGVNAQDVRTGVANYFPQMLGDQRRERARIRRERQRGRAEGSGQGRAGGPRRARAAEQAPAEAEDEDGAEAGPNNAEVEPIVDSDASQDSIENRQRHRAASIPWDDEDHWRSGNFNVAPRSNVAVVRLRHKANRLRGGGDGGEKVTEEKDAEKIELDVGDQELCIESMQWGLIPHWSKHAPSGPLNTINARSENLIDNAPGMWASLKGPKRCLIVVHGYYEWQKKPGGTKVAHFTKLPSPSSVSTPHLMLLAGLYDTVKYVDSPASDPPLKTCTILTTTPSKSLEFLHDRMPCVLDKEEELIKWLDCRDGWDAGVAKLLRPYEGEVECYPVPNEVGKVGTNSSTYVEPVSERKDGIASFFKRQEAKQPAAKAKTEVKGPSKAATPVKKEDVKEKKPSSPTSAKPKSKGKEVHSPTKADVKGLEGVGDDSNAPQSQEDKKSGKRKAPAEGTRKSKRMKKEGSDDGIEVIDVE